MVRSWPIKRILQRWLNALGEQSPLLARVLLFTVRAFPRLYVFVARTTHLEDLASRRVWTIGSGPLSGRKLTGLMPDEILHVLANTMEIRCSSLLADLGMEGTTVVDVGASYGYYALLCARLVGDHGRVYSFEPDPQSFCRLVRNLEMNHAQNVTPVAIGLTNSSGLRRWASDHSQPWLSRAVEDAAGRGRLQIVPVTTLDQFSAAAGISDDVRLVKIDVEGAELEVLDGMRQLLNTVQPTILCELHAASIADRVFTFLRNAGYRWRIVEYVSEDRQHILAEPDGDSAKMSKQ